MKALKKIINKVIIVTCGFCILFVNGCKKGEWYDVKSDKKLAVPTTIKDLQALLDNGNVFNTFSPSLGEIASDGHYISDAVANSITGAGGPGKNAYTWSHEQPYRNVADWTNGYTSGSYVRIYYANLVLEGVSAVTSNTQSELNEIKNIRGQALFHRGKTFYELSQIFAPPYQTDGAGNKLGIPLRLESDINIPSKRSSLQQTYDQIIKDLVGALELLPESPLYRTRPSKQAVYALLARIYLSMENYEAANNYAELCLKSYSTLTSYTSLNVIGVGNPFIGYFPEVIFYCYMFQWHPLFFSNILIDESLYNSYQNNDLRKQAFFNQNTLSNLVTYKGTYAGLGFSNCFSGLATDEIYLIRAECSARRGDFIKAMSDLNLLLKTRWSGPYTDLIAANAEDALRKVLEERKKELILRGLRWSDLRRLNRDPRFAITLTRKIGDKIYTLEPNTYKYTFPIPDDIIEMTGMEQNEGW